MTPPQRGEADLSPFRGPNATRYRGSPAGGHEGAGASDAFEAVLQEEQGSPGTQDVTFAQCLSVDTPRQISRART